MQRKRSPKYARVDTKPCVSCGTCVLVCPREAISVYRGCWAVVDTERCIGCNKCGKACPAGCITMVRREAEVLEKALV